MKQMRAWPGPEVDTFSSRPPTRVRNGSVTHSRVGASSTGAEPIEPMSAVSIQRESDPRLSKQQALPAGKPRLLILDDDPRALRIFRRILVQADRYCLTFERPKELIDALHRNPEVDVVLSDVRMPDADGIELIREIRSRFSERSWLQFVLVTGQASMDTAISALRLEAVDYLFKPVMPRELLRAVNTAMARTRWLRVRVGAHDGRCSRERLAELARTARLLAVELSTLARGVRDSLSADRSDATTNEGSALSATDSCDYESLRFLSTLSEERRRLFGKALLPDPAWEMLVELMLGRYAGRRICVTSLCLASKTPVTTALRRIEELIAEGLVVRSPDANDRRRSYVYLSDLGAERMQQYLASVSENLALEMPQHVLKS